MLDSLRTRTETRRKARDIYGAVVTQARKEGFYADLGVPDTPVGRFEMVALHLFLALEGLRGAAVPEALSRMLVEAFVIDMDDSLRELGTGDLSVPKKVKRAAAAFYERNLAYRAAIEAADKDLLTGALTEYVYAGVAAAEAGDLAQYVRNAAAVLARPDAVGALAKGQAFEAVNGAEGEGA